MLKPGEEAYKRLQEIAAVSAPGPGVTRLPFTGEHRKAIELLKSWMEQAGLSVHLDDAGTLIGRREGCKTSKTLLLGSHQDSVPQGGKYDGILGVVLPIVCLEALKDEPLPFAVEVLAFADEEGVRFPTALIGPRALAGSFDPQVLQMTDRDGITIHQALAAIGCDGNKIAELERKPEDLLGYVEVHMEQGPVLEDSDVPVGVVTSICGIERWVVRLEGKAAHAGTTPMNLRHDALAGAAEIILNVEETCRKTSDLVGVVGELNVIPNAVNAVPGRVDFQIELRSGTDNVRIGAGKNIASLVKDIAELRALKAEVTRTYAQKAAPCDRELSRVLADACSDIGIVAPRLMSGATHDASAMAELTRMAMLFVRCRDGISHNPQEAITRQDAETAARVLIAFLKHLSRPRSAA